MERFRNHLENQLEKQRELENSFEKHDRRIGFHKAVVA